MFQPEIGREEGALCRADRGHHAVYSGGDRFISNSREETLLKRPEHRQKLAEALYRACRDMPTR